MLESKRHPDLAIGSSIARQLDLSGHDVTWLAGGMGVSEKTVYRWFSDENRPSLDDAWRIAELLGCSVAAFFPPEGSRKPVRVVVEVRGRVVHRETATQGSLIHLRIG